MRTYIVFSLMIIFGLIVILVQLNTPTTDYFYPFWRQISGVLLIGGTISLLFKIFVDRENRDFILKSLGIHKSIEEIGLVKVIPDFHGDRTNAYIKLINDSSELYILMNDGLNWIENYSSHLEKRFNEKTQTEFFIVDEKGVFVDSLAKKVNASKESQVRRIQDARKGLQNIYDRSKKRGDLRVYALKHFPTYTLLASEDQAFWVPYYTAEGFNNIPPLFQFKKSSKGSFANKLIKEFNDLRKTSELKYDSNNPT